MKTSESAGTTVWRTLERCSPSEVRSLGEPGRRDCTTSRRTKGTSFAEKFFYG
jgi:hypothetical protein